MNYVMSENYTYVSVETMRNAFPMVAPPNASAPMRYQPAVKSAHRSRRAVVAKKTDQRRVKTSTPSKS